MNHIKKALKNNKPLMIKPSVALAYMEKIEELNIPIDKNISEVSQILEMIFGKAPMMEKSGSVAVIPVKGVIGKNLSSLDKLCGAIDVDDVSSWVDEVALDPEIKTVVFEHNSPGGTVTGVPELAAKIRALGAIKNTISYTETDCHSASYYLASQSNQFLATESSEIGSVGVYMAIPDYTEAFANEGIKMEVIKSGKYKGMGIEGTSLSKDQHDFLQNDVTETHNTFKKDVKKVRSMIKDEDMEGQSFSGKKAAEKCMITGICSSLNEVLERTSNIE